MLIRALKRIISVLIIISSVIQLTGFSVVFAAGDDYKDPYRTIYLSEYDGDDYYLPANFSYRDGFGSNTQTGHYASWKNVRFDETPVSVELAYGTMHSGTVAEIRLDNVLGPVVATFSPNPTGNMFTKGVIEVNIQKEVTGVHDLYFVWKTGYLNIQSFKFKKYGEDNLGYDIFSGMTEDIIYEDISTNSLSYEIKILNKLGMLGFIQGKNFDSKKTVTKVEFAQALCGFYTDEVDCDESYFYDLPAGHTKSEYVNYLYKRGIIEMTADGHFRPDAAITVQQALNAIIKIYDLPEENNKIVVQAKKNLESEIISGVSGKLSGELTRQNLAKMLSNAIEADYLNYQFDKKGEYGLRSTKGILKETRELDKIYGLVSAVPSTSLSNVESGLAEGEVLIGSDVYNDPKGLASKYLGYNCTVFYKEIDGELYVEGIYPRHNVEEIVIDTTKGDEVLTVSEQLIKYFTKDGATKKKNLDKTVYFVYNGKAIDETIDKFVDATTFRGKIRVVNNKDCTTVLIDEYQNALLKCIDSSEFKYLDKITDTVLDFSQDNTTVYKDSRPIMSSDIPAESVAYIYRSKNTTGSKITRIIILPENEITGVVNSVDEDIIIIDSNEYRIAKENKNTYGLGFCGTFVLNTYGEILWGEKMAESELQLGIFLGFKELVQEGEGVLVKLFTNDGIVKTYECTEKVILDGIARKEFDELVAGKNTYMGLDDVTVKTPVMYMLNGEEKLAILDTYHKGRETMYDSLVKVGQDKKYRFSNNSRILVEQGTAFGYGSVPFASESTLVSYWEGTDESCIVMEPFKNQISSNDFPTGQAYSTKGNERIADIFVWRDRTKQNNAESISDFILVDKVIETLNEYDEPTKVIVGYTGTQKVTRSISDQSSVDTENMNKILNNLKRGDYIHIKADPKNNILEIAVNYFCDGVQSRAGIPAILYKNNGGSGGSYRTNHDLHLSGVKVLGKIVDIEDNFMFVSSGDGTNAFEEVYSLSNPTIIKANGSEIVTGLAIKEVFNSSTYGANAVVTVSNGRAENIIIYE